MLWVWASSGFKDKTIVPSSGVLQCQTALWPLITYIHFYDDFINEIIIKMMKNHDFFSRWSAYKFPHTTVSSVSVFEYRMCWENKPAPAPIALQDLPCVISLHVLNGWVVTDIWCEFDVNLIFRNILEKPRKLVMCSIFRFPTSSFGPLEWRANTQYKLTCLRLRWILFFICIQTNDLHSVKPTQSQFWLTVPNTCTHKI